MSYLDDFEKELRARLGSNDDPGYAEFVDDIVKLVRAKLLESYKNGAAAERARKQKPTQKSKASK